MKVTLEIEKDKVADFLNFVRNIDFIRIRDKEETIKKANEEIRNSIKSAVEEMKLIKAGKLKGIPAEQLLDEL
jgi:hypothetical protein